MMKRATRRVLAKSVLLSGALFGAAVVVATRSFREEPVLLASANHTRFDRDGDGLSDGQEAVLRTLPDRSDTDGDGFSDLEELARQSDPLSATSTPSASDVSLGMCASSDGQYIRVLSAAFLEHGDFTNFRMRIGIVYGGRGYSVAPAGLRTARGYWFNTSTAAGRMGVVEFTFPKSLLDRFGQLNLYAIGMRVNEAPCVASVLPLVNMGGVATVVEPHEFQTLGGPRTGVVYRPLGGNSSAPMNWTAGEVCWQRTAVVGTDGAMLIQEVEAASCIPMDSFCSGGGCSASVGTVLQIPNPAALGGG